MTAPQFRFGDIVGWVEEMDRPEDEQGRLMVIDTDRQFLEISVVLLLSLRVASDVTSNWEELDIEPVIADYLYLVEGPSR